MDFPWISAFFGHKPHIFGPARPLMFGSLGAKPKECRIAGTGDFQQQQLV
jgi:hypothetical protein